MLHHDKQIKLFLEKLISTDVKNVVISPGSRSTPLVNNFLNNSEFFDIDLVLDERSAAYFALGKAKKLLCAKKRFAPYTGEWRDWCNDYEFKSLEFAMKFAGLTYSIDGFDSLACRPHRAFIDCIATMRLWNWMNSNELGLLNKIKDFSYENKKVIGIENAIY